MKLAYMGYREWADKIFEKLLFTDFPIVGIDEAEIILYIGWSKMIPKNIYQNKLCLLLHPSPLPKYRGGSPLQHQIMAGEKMSAVTICKVTDKLDSGDIYSQTPFSLEGSLDDIFKRIVEVGSKDIIDILYALENGKSTPISPTPQKGKATYFKRRKPEESEIKQFKTAKESYNFIRALNDPYPNAFIRCKDGKKLYITGAHL